MVGHDGLETSGKDESPPATALQLAVGRSPSTSLVLSSIFYKIRRNLIKGGILEKCFYNSMMKFIRNI